jgi:hypothetical protein
VKRRVTAGSLAAAVFFFLAAGLAAGVAEHGSEVGAQLSAPGGAACQASALRSRPAKVFAVASPSVPSLEPIPPVAVMREPRSVAAVAGDRLPPPSTRGPPRA